MSERKGTPDILGEILGGQPISAPERTREHTSKTETKPKSPALKTPAPSKPSRPRSARPKDTAGTTVETNSQSWEYQVVSFQQKDGWKPRFINGLNVKDWAAGPLIHEFLQLMDRDRWELVSATSAKRLYGETDGLQLYFRRRAK